MDILLQSKSIYKQKNSIIHEQNLFNIVIVQALPLLKTATVWVLNANGHLVMEQEIVLEL